MGWDAWFTNKTWLVPCLYWFPTSLLSTYFPIHSETRFSPGQRERLLCFHGPDPIWLDYLSSAFSVHICNGAGAKGGFSYAGLVKKKLYCDWIILLFSLLLFPIYHEYPHTPSRTISTYVLDNESYPSPPQQNLYGLKVESVCYILALV